MRALFLASSATQLTAFALFSFALLNGCETKRSAPNLLEHARKGDLNGVKQRLALGDDVNQSERWGFNRENKGETALQYAVQQGRGDIVQLLIDHKADVNLTHLGYAPLGHAAVKDHIEIARLLLKSGANPNLGSKFSERSYETPLYLALRFGTPEMADLLVANGARVHLVLFEDLLNPYHKEETAKIVRAVEFLIKNGFDPTKTFKEPQGDVYPLYVAVRCGQPQVVRLLIDKGADVDAMSSYGRMALHQAANRGDQEIVKILLKAGADINANRGGNSALTEALTLGQFDMADLLIKHKAKATIEIYEQLLVSARPKNDVRQKGIDFLLLHGLDSNARDVAGNNLLLWMAQKYDRHDVVKHLRAKGIK